MRSGRVETGLAGPPPPAAARRRGAEWGKWCWTHIRWFAYRPGSPFPLPGGPGSHPRVLSPGFSAPSHGRLRARSPKQDGDERIAPTRRVKEAIVASDTIAGDCQDPFVAIPSGDVLPGSWLVSASCYRDRRYRYYC